MIGYMDKTWCMWKDCDGSCGRQFTDNDRQRAIKWWGSEDFPIARCDPINAFHNREPVKGHKQQNKNDWWDCKCGKQHRIFPYVCLERGDQ